MNGEVVAPRAKKKITIIGVLLIKGEIDVGLFSECFTPPGDSIGTLVDFFVTYATNHAFATVVSPSEAVDQKSRCNLFFYVAH